MSPKASAISVTLLLALGGGCGSTRPRRGQIWADEPGLHAIGSTMLVLSTRAANVDEGWFVATAVPHDDDGDGILCPYGDQSRVVLHHDGRERVFDAFVGIRGREVIVVEDRRLLAVDVTTGAGRVAYERDVACTTWSDAACSDAFVDRLGRIVAVTPRNSVVVISADEAQPIEIAGGASPVVRAELERSGEWLGLWAHSDDPADSEMSHCEGPSCMSLRGLEVVSLLTGTRHSFPDAVDAGLRPWGGVVQNGANVVQFGNDGARVVGEGCWTEAIGFESAVVVLWCGGERHILTPQDLRPIDAQWLFLLDDMEGVVSADWWYDDPRVSIRERAWTRQRDAWMPLPDSSPSACPLLALGRERRALALGAAEGRSCRDGGPHRYAWTEPIAPQLCATPPRLPSYTRD